MSAEKLAFLQNFYTDVTLYVPAEPATEAARAAVAVAPVKPASVKAAPVVARTAPVKPAREVQLPPTGFSRPSAGLERLGAGFGHPRTAAELAAAPATHPTDRPEQAPVAAIAASSPSAAAAAPLPPSEPAGASIPPVMLTRFTTLGSNAQGIVLLFRLPAEQFVKLHRNVFLNKLLQALGFVMTDIVLVNVESELPVALANLRRELAATQIIAFGKNLLDTTIRNTQIYEPVFFPNLNLAYLASATVDLVEYDVSLKKRLWPGLQRMFLG